MKFKIDENLPIEFATILIEAGYDALTIVDENLQGEIDPYVIDVCVQEERVLITLDLDFADIRAYPPHRFPGIIVFRLKSQDKPRLVGVLRRILPLLKQE